MSVRQRKKRLKTAPNKAFHPKPLKKVAIVPTAIAARSGIFYGMGQPVIR